MILTARATDHDAVEAQFQGAGEYLTKPCSMADLLAVVKRVLGTAGTAED